MVENQRNMTIDLHIKNLQVKVTEHTPVYVMWQRGNKKAKTKSRLLNEAISQAVIDEKFQISTIMEVDSSGQPTKPKMVRLVKGIIIQSKLTIVGDKGKGTLGEADLNLSDYSEGEYRIMKLALKQCADPDGFIEIGLRATQAKEKESSTPKSSSKREGRDSMATDVHSKDQVMSLIEDLDKEKKAAKKVKQDYEEKIRGLTEKINDLQTSLENTKTDLSYLHKQKKAWAGDKEAMEKEMDTLKKRIAKGEADLQDKEYEIKKMKGALRDKDEELNKLSSNIENYKNQSSKEVKDLSTQLEKAKLDLRRFYDFERFDIDYVADASIFSKNQDQTSTQHQQNQVVITTPGTRQSRASTGVK